ncbi:unnamed protein product [Larinioides sclopetarius]|uniref:Uncharacterized protein n=1 Tax=Larinioides sclopetarius TaxID=280406 RepID=A0AAV2B3F6_9ARAC
MSFSRTIHLSTNGKLPYQEIQFTENVLKTRRKWITVSLVSVAIVAVSLITFGEGHIIVGSVFLSAVPVFLGLFWLVQKYELNWSKCLGCLRRMFCLKTDSLIMPTPV